MTPEERLAQLEAGNNPALIAKLPSGFAVMSNSQFLPGYCLLLAYPQVANLNALKGATRDQFLTDMGRLGDAVLAVTGCKRINYSIYGNLDPFLHAHVWPRYDWEDESYRTLPPFLIPSDLREAPEKQFSIEKHAELLEKIRAELLVI